MNDDERSEFTAHINSVLAGDMHIGDRIPIPTHTMQIFDECRGKDKDIRSLLKKFILLFFRRHQLKVCQKKEDKPFSRSRVEQATVLGRKK